MQNWGWACENIVALDMVTADGRLIRVDDQQNSDLLFAARGAGPGRVEASQTRTRLTVARFSGSRDKIPFKGAKVVSWYAGVDVRIPDCQV